MGAQESKLKEAFAQLAACDRVFSIQDDAFWESLWAEPIVPLHSVYEHLSIEAVKRIKELCPKNLATLVRRAVLKLNAATNTGVHCAAAQAQVVNATRVLTRIIPVVLEDPAWDGFWGTPTPVGVIISMPPNSTARKRIIDPHPTTVEICESAENRPLFETLLSAIIDLCFAPGFTVSNPSKQRFPHMDTPPEATKPIREVAAEDYIWAPGIGSTRTLTTTATLESRKCDVLRLLLVCLSKPLYASPATLHPAGSFWLYFLTHPAMHPPKMPAFLLSLFNSLFGYDPIGYGVPYGNVMVPDSEHETAVQLAGQLLALMADYACPAPGLGPGGADATAPNALMTMLAGLQSDNALAFVTHGARHLLTTPLLTTWLPGSFKRAQLHHEIIVLLWKLLEANPRFLAHLLESSDCLDLLVPILHHVYVERQNSAKIGLVHIGVYIALILSGERNFSVRLNKPFVQSLEMAIPPVDGHHGDLLITVVHALMMSTNYRMTPLYDILATTLVNVSPFLKSLSLTSANKLVHLFEVFSSPRFLMAAEHNFQLTQSLLEMFNNVIQYQFEGNHHLIYVLVRRRQLFQRLVTFALPRSDAAETLGAGHQANSSPTQVVRAAYELVADKSPPPPPPPPSPPSLPAQGPVLSTRAESVDGTGASASSSTPTAAAAAAAAFSPDASLAPLHRPSSSSTQAQVWSSLEGAGPSEHFTVTAPTQPDSASAPQPPSETAMGGFEPTQAWVDSWLPLLPLETMKRLLQVLVPQIEKLCLEKGVTDEVVILTYLKNGTLVGLLPTPHPILIRKFLTGQAASVWFNVYIWAVVYLSHLDPALWHGTHVRLFKVSVPEAH